MTTRGFSYGGQAVPEGVMMRGQHQATVAVRRPDGSIAYRHEQFNYAQRRLYSRVPLLRGMLALWDTLGLGMRAMTFAALVAAGEEEQSIGRGQIALVITTMLGVLIGLFFVAPMLAGEALVALLPTGLGGSQGTTAHMLVRECAEALLRLALFIGYLALLGRSSQTQRLFGYHGAEHKTVNAYEAGATLRTGEIRRFGLIHPRCGTSFLLLVILISIIVFAFFGALPFWTRLLSRIVLVPFIAALTYELVRLAAAHYHRQWVRTLLAPTLALQRLTTREPDDTMIEIAIAALLPVLKADGKIVAQQYEQARSATPTTA